MPVVSLHISVLPRADRGQGESVANRLRTYPILGFRGLGSVHRHGIDRYDPTHWTLNHELATR